MSYFGLCITFFGLPGLLACPQSRARGWLTTAQNLDLEGLPRALSTPNHFFVVLLSQRQQMVARSLFKIGCLSP